MPATIDTPSADKSSDDQLCGGWHQKPSRRAPKVATSPRWHSTLPTWPHLRLPRHAAAEYVELCIPLVVINVSRAWCGMYPVRHRCEADHASRGATWRLGSLRINYYRAFYSIHSILTDGLAWWAMHLGKHNLTLRWHLELGTLRRLAIGVVSSRARCGCCRMGWCWGNMLSQPKIQITIDI
jgi:hypothetical protein